MKLKVENTRTFFTNRMKQGDVVRCPVAHGEGNYVCDDETLKALEGEGRVVFRYAEATNPNGATNDIAGIVNEDGNVIGMMPHPENMIEPLHGNDRLPPALRKPARRVSAEVTVSTGRATASMCAPS